MPKIKETSTTTLVLDALRQADDFMDRRMLMAATGRSDNQVSAALFHLRKVKVVDVVVNPDGQGWWFALPPDGDTRIRVIDEHVPHGRRNRRKGERRGKKS